MTDTVSVPQELWEKFTALFSRAEKSIEVDAEQFSALKQERDEFAAKLEQFEAEKKRADMLTALTRDLQDKQKFGSMYIEMGKASEAAEYLARMDEDTREWCMRNFSALAAQAEKPELFTEKGTNQPAPENKTDLLMATIKARQEADKTDFASAYEAVKLESPDLFKA